MLQYSAVANRENTALLLPSGGSNTADHPALRRDASPQKLSIMQGFSSRFRRRLVAIASLRYGPGKLMRKLCILHPLWRDLTSYPAIRSGLLMSCAFENPLEHIEVEHMASDVGTCEEMKSHGSCNTKSDAFRSPGCCIHVIRGKKSSTGPVCGRCAIMYSPVLE